jgi:hypothetical protein
MFFDKYGNIFGHDKLKNLYVSDTLMVFYCKIISYTFNIINYHVRGRGRATDRDEYNHRKVQLSDVFKEQISLAKKELNEITKSEQYDYMYFTTDYRNLKNCACWKGWF